MYGFNIKIKCNELQVEARSLKEQFEKVGESENENIDEKRKIIEEEFARLKRLYKKILNLFTVFHILCF